MSVKNNRRKVAVVWRQLKTN